MTEPVRRLLRDDREWHILIADSEVQVTNADEEGRKLRGWTWKDPVVYVVRRSLAEAARAAMEDLDSGEESL